MTLRESGFWALQIAALSAAFLKVDIEWQPLVAFLSGSAMVYAMAARRMNRWWL